MIRFDREHSIVILEDHSSDTAPRILIDLANGGRIHIEHEVWMTANDMATFSDLLFEAAKVLVIITSALKKGYSLEDFMTEYEKQEGKPHA